MSAVKYGTLLLLTAGAVALGAANVATEARGVYFGEPLLGLSTGELEEYRQGFDLFVKIWPIVKGAKVNARSCAACHRIPLPGGSGTSGDTFVIHSTSYRDAAGGTTLPRFVAAPGGTLEPIAESGEFTDAFRRRTQPLFGLGLLEAVEISTLRPNPADTELARGRLPCQEMGCGRFGWKSIGVSIDDFVERAFTVELGLRTSSDGSTPLSPRDVELVSQFIRFLAAPPENSGRESKGRRLFESCGCAECHRPVLSTGAVRSAALARQEITPYTDLLLHDMGPAFNDGGPEGMASATEYRTPPLWGIRFTGPPYLHDGRAQSIEAAISAHAGQGATASQRFQRLSDDERDALLQFLRQL